MGTFHYKSVLVAALLVTVTVTVGAEAKSNESYIVVLKKAPAFATQQFVANTFNALADKRRLRVRKIFSILNGGVYDMSEEQALEVAREPQVAYVEKDHVVHVSAKQSGATWGLDRLDQASLPLDQSFSYPDAGAAVNAYIVDTGILTTHQEFGGRASSAVDIVDDDGDATDCNGHGTHVAGTVAGKNYGVAKNAKLFAVRVLDCDGSGTYSGVIAGIEWVTKNHIKPAVANMSLGGPASQAVDDAVAASIQAGVTYVLAAGNENTSACDGSPSRVPSAITVGATNKSDARSSFSNFGPCVDVFAPGEAITSSWYASPSATNTISGTSMAAPHVAGVAALYLAQHPAAKPEEVAQALVANSVSGKVTNPGSGSPNKLANTAFLGGGGNGGGGGGDDKSVLKNGVPVADLKGARGSEQFFSLSVPAGAKSIAFVISGGSGDVDLYVRKGSKPSTSAYDCRPYRNGNNESCTVTSSAAATYHVLLRGYAIYAGVTLKATY